MSLTLCETQGDILLCILLCIHSIKKFKEVSGNGNLKCYVINVIISFVYNEINFNVLSHYLFISRNSVLENTSCLTLPQGN